MQLRQSARQDPTVDEYSAKQAKQNSRWHETGQSTWLNNSAQNLFFTGTVQYPVRRIYIPVHTYDHCTAKCEWATRIDSSQCGGNCKGSTQSGAENANTRKSNIWKKETATTLACIMMREKKLYLEETLFIM